ncbi:ASCH domain-containing protein [Ralstonia solanacearum]|uniref:ASCH domain-containing protein n=1 Tax=Ralstonia solanacearum TaxID=305 RepID=UPI00399D6AF8
MLIIPVRGVYFDQIKTDTKPREYRLNTAYWQKRLLGRTYDRIVLTRGYPKKDDSERRLTLPWRGYQVEQITHPHFGAYPVVVFAIDVSGGAL